MCVMIRVDRKKATETIKEFNPEYIKVYCHDNNHGWGFMWHEDARVKTINKMGTPEEAVEMWKTFVDANIDFAFHCRLASMGDKTVENTHPVKIQNIDDGDPKDWYYMHNGTIHDVSVEKSMSDTCNYAKHYIRPILKDYPDILSKDSFLDLLEVHLGHNKLIILNSDAEWTVVNEELGQEWKDGIWISNKSTPSTYIAKSPIYNIPKNIQAAWGMVDDDDYGMGGTPATGAVTRLALPSATTGSQRKKDDGNDNSSGTWSFDADERSHYERIKVYETDDMVWGECPLDELLPKLTTLDEEGFFEFVMNNPYEATDCMYDLSRKNVVEFPKICHKNKTELIMWAMGDPIDFADQLACCVLFDGEASESAGD